MFLSLSYLCLFSDLFKARGFNLTDFLSSLLSKVSCKGRLMDAPVSIEWVLSSFISPLLYALQGNTNKYIFTTRWEGIHDLISTHPSPYMGSILLVFGGCWSRLPSFSSSHDDVDSKAVFFSQFH
jgi:hypothetical protein